MTALTNCPDLEIDRQAYCLEVTGDSMLPVYREGDILMVSPAARVSKGDRVIIRLVTGEVIARVIHSERIPLLKLGQLDPAKPFELRGLSTIESIHRIVWARQ